jgi:hypothetical protein
MLRIEHVSDIGIRERVTPAKKANIKMVKSFM